MIYNVIEKKNSLSANPTHFSNSSESIKLFEEVIISYLQKERKKLNFSPIQKALIIKTSIRCFQKTNDVRNTYDPQGQQYLSRTYSTKHDKILEKYVQHMVRELNFETTQ